MSSFAKITEPSNFIAMVTTIHRCWWWKKNIRHQSNEHWMEIAPKKKKMQTKKRSLKGNSWLNDWDYKKNNEQHKYWNSRSLKYDRMISLYENWRQCVCAFLFHHSFFSFLVFFFYHLLCSCLWSVRMYFWCLYRRWGCFVLSSCSAAYFPMYTKQIQGLECAILLLRGYFSSSFSPLFISLSLC